jgi:hypothetical protein
VGSTGTHLLQLGLPTKQAQALLKALLAYQPAASKNPPLSQSHSSRIHDVRLRLPGVMLDTITLPGNLILGFGVPSALKSMLKNQFHLILERAFYLNGMWWGLYPPAAFPVRLKKRYVKHRMDSLARIHL